MNLVIFSKIWRNLLCNFYWLFFTLHLRVCAWFNVLDKLIIKIYDLLCVAVCGGGETALSFVISALAVAGVFLLMLYTVSESHRHRVVSIGNVMTHTCFNQRLCNKLFVINFIDKWEWRCLISWYLRCGVHRQNSNPSNKLD